MARERDLNWGAWYETVAAEGLLPLLYRILHGQGIIPNAIDEKLEVVYYQSLRRNALLFRELECVLHSLAAQQITVILLKGAALAETVYGNIALRPMDDLDLLVRHEDARGALATLTALGYTRMGPKEKRADAAIEFEIEAVLRKPGPVNTQIEVHWGLLDSPYYQHRLPMTWFWETARPLRVGGAEGLMLGAEAQILHLCAHLVLGHHGEGLRWLHDVAEVLYYDRGQLDWDALLAKAQECDLVLPLKQVLSQVVEGWAVPIPPLALARLSALQPSPEEIRVFNWLVSFDWDAQGGRTAARHFWADLVTLPGWRQRLRYAWSILFPSAAYMRQRYRVSHDGLLPLYYPYRWLIGLRGAIRLLSKRETEV